MDTQRVLSKIWLQYCGGRELGVSVEKEMEIVKRCLTYCVKNDVEVKWWGGQEVEWNCKNARCIHSYRKNQLVDWPIRDLCMDGFCWKCFAGRIKLG